MSQQQKNDLERNPTQPAQPTKMRWIAIATALIVGLVISALVTVRGRSTVPPGREPSELALPRRDPSPIADVQPGGVTQQPEVVNQSKDARLPARRRPSWNEIDDPAKDGWDTEVFHGKAKKQLAAIGHLLTHPSEIEATRVAELITDDFGCGALRPGHLITVVENQGLKVQRAVGINAVHNQGAYTPRSALQLPHRGAEGLVDALRAAAETFSGAKDLRLEFKVFHVLAAPGEVSTRQYVAISGRTETGMVEQNATWVIRWALGTSGTLPRVRSIRVEKFEQVASRQAGGVLFSDCTASILENNASYADQFLRGLNYWFERIQASHNLAFLGNPGLAVGDVNGDGLDDLYVCQEAGLPNRLFIQNGDGTAREESKAWGVDWLDASRGALLVDLDNDSDQDLVVAVLGGVLVAENDGQGQFHIRDILGSKDDTMSLSAVDYDRDGRVDIYVCLYGQNRDLDRTDSEALPGAAAGFVYHDANDGENNSLFRNEISADGTWRFTDVTREAGLDVNNQRYSFAAAWDDFDNDGDQDLYVANDFGRDNLYRNDPPRPPHSKVRRFVDISEEAHIENAASGMSVTCGDYDRDGWMDVYVGNMFSAAGNRIAFQSKFQPDAPQDIRRRLQRFARGNTLLRNQGDGTFDDRSGPAGVEMGRWAWGCHFVDVNNDGWEDVIVSNGYITTEDTGDL